MHCLRRPRTQTALLLAGAVGVALGVQAQSQQAGQQPDRERWSEMEGQVVRAEELLEGNVSNGLNPIGTVSDLVLSEDGSRVEYILYEVPYPYSFFGAEDGFSTFEGVEFSRGVGLETEVRLSPDDRPRAPEELELTAAEAERRLVSRIINDSIFFSEEEARRVEDLLLDRESGEVLHYVVEMDPDAIFSADRRTVPAEQVRIDDQGEVTATVELAGLDDVQQYDSELL